MTASLLSLPSELRIEIFKYLLVRKRPIAPLYGICTRRYAFRGLEPNLLRTNKLFLAEARPLLYGHNCFHFGLYFLSDNNRLELFLENIGSTNASQIRKIHLNFPSFSKAKDFDDVNLDPDCVQAFEKIQSKCTSLQTLVIGADATCFMHYVFNWLGSPQLCDRALGLLAARFKGIPSLQKIVVKAYKGHLSSHIRSRMESRGWILEVVENTSSRSDVVEAVEEACRKYLTS
ncbi:hypothetical protein N7461_003408 [Penicillium sp. DV-2018c]|nr:hypothetical protein N7461_003408 [Penicillium sp. DV-2018c]